MTKTLQLNKLISEIESDSHCAMILLEEIYKCTEKHSIPQMFTRLALTRIRSMHQKYEEINSLFEP